ncbi:MFS transporter [Kitasatospora azatica]|uniref:MFS transporter n=1 Tax=Kitasatospora azatica TaxID=58347 RepID=UPI00055A4531|nr:MFS transporter [Kitasatospora azatica]
MTALTDAAPGTSPRRSVATVVRHAPRPVKLLVTGVFVNRLGSFFATFATLFLQSRGFSGALLTYALTAIAAASMIGSWAGGVLAGRYGNHRVIVLSMAASSASLVLLSQAHQHLTVGLAVCLVSTTSQAYVPAASTLLAAHSSPEDRVPIFALFRLALNLGSAVGPLLAGLLALHSFTTLFAVNAATCALCAAVLQWGARSRSGSDGPQQQDEPAPDDRAGAAERARTGQVRILCGLLFVVAAVYALHLSALPLQLTADGQSAAFYAMLLSVNGFVVLGGELPISSVTRRAPWRVPLAGGVLVMATGLVLAGLLRQSWAIIGGIVLFTVGEMIFAPVANAAVAALAPQSQLARYQGLLAVAQTAGFTIGPAVGVALWNEARHGFWIGVLALAAVLALAILLIGTTRGETNE